MEEKRASMREAVKEMENSPEGQAILKLEELCLLLGGKDAQIQLAGDYAMWLEEEAHKLDEALMNDEKDAGKIADLFISIQHKIIRLNELLHRPIPEA